MTSWILLAITDEGRVHGGNEGYLDEPEKEYVWDSTVPRHGELQAGDRIAIRNEDQLLGVSVIDAIGTLDTTKLRRRCPHCRSTDIRERKIKRPRWYCAACREAFEAAAHEQIEVTEYRSAHGSAWIDMRDLAIPPKQLMAAQSRPQSQHSLRPANWSVVVQLLSTSSDDAQLVSRVANLGRAHLPSDRDVRFPGHGYRGSPG